MNISRHNFVTADVILSDVLSECDDADFRYATHGWYLSQVQQALEEMSFDSYYSRKVDSFPVPNNLQLPMPKGMFNLQNMYLYNGNECNISNAVNVYWKRNYFTRGEGFLAKNKERNGRDPFYFDDINRNGYNTYGGFGNYYADNPRFTIKQNLYYFNIMDGIIMFSTACRDFENVFIEYVSTGIDIGEDPFIPIMLRQAVKDWVSVKALRNRAVKADAGDAKTNLFLSLASATENRLNNPRNGSWEEAIDRVSRMDKKQREDMQEYFSRFNH